MNHNALNKLAWEEAFDKRRPGWGDDIADRIANEVSPFLEKPLIDVLKEFDLVDRAIAQFCCNNGRELMSLVKLGAKSGVGFDIAENMVTFANAMAQRLGLACMFVSTDILNIDSQYFDKFDYIFITIGALTWFGDLEAFFRKVNLCLKTGGYVVIHEMHPVTNMFAMPDESNFIESCPGSLVNSYFKTEPWVENTGMGYMSDPTEVYEKVFYSYSHTFASIINSLSSNGLAIRRLNEYESDISGCFPSLDEKGMPLSYILIAQK